MDYKNHLTMIHIPG